MKNIKWHLLFWLGYFLLAYFSDLALESDVSLTTEILFFTTQNLYLFYGFLYVLSAFSRDSPGKLAISILRLVLVLVVFFLIRYYVRYHFLPTYYHPAYGDLTIEKWIWGGVLWIVDHFIYASAYFYLRSSLRKQKDILRIRETQLIHEKEKVELENLALQAQINPHFLYNTLDFFYAKALPLNAELSDAIIRLSDIMRYSIQKPKSGDGMVSLSEELEHIENVIYVNRLRYNHSLNLNFNSTGDAEDIRIIPLVLITLVENVLKHGKLGDAAHPANISIVIDEWQCLTMTTYNQKRKGPKDPSTGIGVDNLKRRLQAVYPGKHKFDIREDQDSYETELTLIPA